MENSIIAKKEREQIFELFLKQDLLKFNEIEKQLKLRSNHLNYHLDKMLKNGVIEKSNGYYKLTKDAEKMIPFFTHITGKERGPLPVVVAAVVNKNKICLLKRAKRPYKGYWGLVGGKLRLEETVKEAVLREVKEETDLDCKFERIVSVLHEHVNENDVIKHAFIIFLCKLTTKQDNFRQNDEGQLAWFSINKLPQKIIPSDRFMIKELLNKNFCYKNVVIKEKENKLVKMELNLS